MSAKTDEFERRIASCISCGEALPATLPTWMASIGVIPGAIVNRVTRMGASGGKTDIFIEFEQGNPIKISAKLACADYFGNWYSHNRIISEFGEPTFYKLTASCTRWANQWLYSNQASFFIGVSISFGKRSGNTCEEFTSVFDFNDIKTIVAGNGSGNESANCLLISDDVPSSLYDLIQQLRPIDQQTIMSLSHNFKVIYRPINTQTEGTNRGKCTFTQFSPKRRADVLTRISTLNQLQELGAFIEVQPNSLNHNRLAEYLRTEYNLDIAIRRP